MKAIRIHATGATPDIRLDEIDDAPPPGPGEVTVEILITTINPADLLIVAGRYGFAPPLPAIPGVEAVARVTAVGDGVTDPAPGDTVIVLAPWTWRERITLPAASAVALPAGIAPEQAAMIRVNPTTALAMLTGLVPPGEGEWVVQNAANSAVGRLVIQLARLNGLRTVNIVRRDGPQAALQALGGDAVLVDDGADPGRLAAAVAGATGGAPVRLGLDAVGGAATGALAAALGESATLVNYGLLSGEPCRIDPHHLVFRDLVVRGFWLSRWGRAQGEAAMRGHYRRLAALFAAGDLATAVEAVYPFAQVSEAVAHAARGGRDGKVLLRP